MVKNKGQYQFSYALALYQLIVESSNNKLNTIEHHTVMAKNCLKVFNNNLLIIPLLNAYELSETKKSQILNSLFDFINKNLASNQKIWLNFFKILTNKRHWNLIIPILVQLVKMLNQKLKIRTGIVYSTNLLTETQLNLMTKKMQVYFPEKLELFQKLDPTLIGGFKIVINNQEFNYSILFQLQQLKHNLLTENKNNHE